MMHSTTVMMKIFSMLKAEETISNMEELFNVADEKKTKNDFMYDTTYKGATQMTKAVNDVRGEEDKNEYNTNQQAITGQINANSCIYSVFY